MYRDPKKPVFHLGYVSALMFLAVAGAMNFKYASTLGTTETDQRVYQALAIGITLYSVIGWGVIQKNWKAGETFRAGMAAILLGLCLTYDGLAAYGFNARQQTVSQDAYDDALRKHNAAKQDLKAVETRFRAFGAVVEPEIAKSTVDLLEQELPDGKCQESKLHKSTLAQCDKLREARQVLARSDAYTSLKQDVAIARIRLDENPMPPPLDGRSEVIGVWWSKWLPVVVIIAGATLSFFVVPFRATFPQDRGSRLGRLWKRRRTPVAAPAVTREPEIEPPARRQPKALTLRMEAAEVIQRLEVLRESPPARLPAQVVIGPDGTIMGAQRHLAKSIDVSLARLNRALAAGREDGSIDLDTSGRATVIRFRRDP